jgi:hypothetical protein
MVRIMPRMPRAVLTVVSVATISMKVFVRKSRASHPRSPLGATYPLKVVTYM